MRADPAHPRVVMLLGNDLAYDSRVQREAQALAQAGYAVTVVARLYDQPLPKDEWLGQVRVLRSDYLTPAWHRLRLPLLRKIYTLLTLLRYGYPQAQFCRLAAAQPATIIHAHDREMLRLGARLARLHGARLVYDAHEFHLALSNERHQRGWRSRLVGALLRRLDERAERRLIHRADAVITVNESLAQLYAERYGIAPPAVVMNCPELSEPQPNQLLRQQAGLATSDVAVLYQGLLAVGRGLLQVVRSIALLPPRYHLIFLGYGPLRERLVQEVHAAGLQQRVHFLRQVPPAELLTWTAAADVGLATIEPINESKRFATPNKLFEYLMAGLPVVASDLPEMRRIMERARAGRLIAAPEPEQIASAISGLVEDPAYATYRRRARAAARERYNWQVESQRLLELYRRLAPVGQPEQPPGSGAAI